jgi:hypothetical protein
MPLAALRVRWVNIFGDQTMTACIIDGTGRRTCVCIDGRESSPTRYRLFQQARHPRQHGAVLVELGGPEEGIVVPLLCHYLESVGPNALGFTEFGWEMARETVLRLGEPAASSPTSRTLDTQAG